jgi:hypothetical protein
MTNITRVREEQLHFCYFDGAQAEARIVAYEANIPKWKEQFERARLNPGSYDAHIALASEMFGVPYDQVPTNDYNDDGSLTLRGIAKRCRHGLNYRMQPPRLAQSAGMSLSEAERNYQLYHRVNPELQIWWKAIENEVRTSRMLVTCLGRRMEFLGSRLDESLMDSIIAFKPQSTLGDLVTGVQWKCQEDDAWPRYARIPFNNHDSLTALCRERDIPTVARLFRKYAEAPLYIKGEELIIPIDIKVSYPDDQGVHRWSNLKKWKG